MKKPPIGREARASRKDQRAAEALPLAEIVTTSDGDVAAKVAEPSDVVHVAHAQGFPVGPSAGRIDAFVELLEKEGSGPRALVEELRTRAMSFFRDGDVLATFAERVFPEVLRTNAHSGTIRIWCAGCGTGEEAYSILLLLLEFLDHSAAASVPIQLFGTDVSEQAISGARAGVYLEGIASAVGAERLARHFDKVEGGFRIKKDVRERCTFVRHDFTRDPPFSKVDLIVCRDALVHLGAEVQRRVISTFHFALNQPGFLLLGPVEGISDGTRWFAPVDEERNIFARSPSVPAPRHEMAAGSSALMGATEYPAPLADVVRRAKTALLDQYAPPGVIVDDRLDILHFRGRTGPFLEPAPGHPQHNLLDMVRKGLRAELRIAVAQARRTKATVRRSNVRVEQNEAQHCDIIVIPIAPSGSSSQGFFAVLFEDRPQGSGAGAIPRSAGRPGHVTDELLVGKLEDELEVAKEYLQSTLVAQERSNDELVSANEELAFGNEELLSLNQELETAKEELQSTNEELSTLNEELRTRNREIHSVNDDLMNVLASVEVPIVIVDGALRIRRVTPKAAAILNLLPGDVGRPIDDIKPNLSIEHLDRKIGEVIRTALMFEEETQDRKGHWYRLQIRAYTTIDKRIDGAVLSVIDIDILKRALGAAVSGRDVAKAAVEGVQTPLLVLDDRLGVYSANEAFQETYAVARTEVEGRKVEDVLGGALAGPPLSISLSGVVSHGERFQRLEISCEVPGLGWRTLSLSGRSVVTPNGERFVLLAVEDDTLRMQRETERAHLLDDATAARASAEAANRTKDLFLATLSHELRTPLASMLLQSQMLQMDNLHDAESVKKAGRAIERATKAQAQLIDDLLDISRIVTGKLKMELAAVRLSVAARAAVETVAALAAKKRIQVELVLDENLPLVACDKARIQQVIVNLLANAIKLTPADGRVTVTVDASEGKGRIRVADTGIGIDAGFLPRIFDRFSQEDRGETRTHGGLGLGLAIVRYLVEAHGGTVQAASAGKGRGATFTILLPLLTEAFVAQNPSGTHPQVNQASIKGVDILVVEDDPATREALTQVLSLRGAAVRSADCAGRAMTAFRERPPQVLLCDISMPDENGHSLLGRIRALDHEHGGDVPAIALTALASEDDRQRSFAAGFQLHMAKPVDTDHLVAALAGLLD